MNDSVALQDIDLRLVDALQVNPRASWASLATTLGTSAMSVSRRWRALSDSGLAWTGSTMGPALFRGVFLEITCSPARAESVASALIAMPEVLTVGSLTGLSTLYAIVVAPSPTSLTRFVERRLTWLVDARLRLDPFPRVFGGPTWRLQVLEPEATSKIRDPPLRRLPPDDGADDRSLFLALAGDARRSLTDLAAELGTTTEGVRRRMERMRAQRLLSLRADVSRPAAGWPLAAVLRLAVPPEEVLAVGRDIAGWPETRFCAPVVAAETMIVIVNLRDVEALSPIGERISARHPAVAVTSRAIIPRLRKVNGRVFGHDGRSAAVIPVDPWFNE